MAGYNDSRPPYYYGAYNDRDGRLLYDMRGDAGRGYSFQEPFIDYRPYYGRTSSFDGRGRGGIVPMEEVLNPTFSHSTVEVHSFLRKQLY